MSASVIVWGTLVVATAAVFAVLSFKIIVRGWAELVTLIKTLISDGGDRPEPLDRGVSEKTDPSGGPHSGGPS